MSTSVICPECDARLNLRAVPAEGARIKCPKCSKQFAYTAPDELDTAAASKKSGKSADLPVRRRRDADDDDEEETPRKRSAARAEDPDDDDEEESPRKRSAARAEESDEDRKPSKKKKKKKKAKAGSNTGLIIGLAVGGVGLVVLGIVAVGIVFWLKRDKPGDVQQQAKVDPPVQVAKNPVAPPQPVKDKNPNPINPGPIVPPAPIVPPGPMVPSGPLVPSGPIVRPGPRPPKKAVNLAELYGDQGGEPVAKADAGLPGTQMRARRDDTFIKLSNPRIDTKGNALLVDYEVVRRGKLDGSALVLGTADGSRAEIPLKSIIEGRDRGTVQLVGAKQFGNFKFRTKTTFPENIEMYVIRGDDRYDPPLKCMVSNSVVMGQMKRTTRARDWTAEEITKYTKSPPAYKNPNGNPTIGEDVPAPPPATGLQRFRYVDPDGPLLGLDYLIGDWDKRKRVWRLAPVYAADQPKQHAARSIARNGYAVAGADVNMDKDKIVSGIRLLFSRIKPDGSLDLKDAYTGEWLGTPPEEGKAIKLVNDGHQIVGIHFHMGSIVERIALVAR